MQISNSPYNGTKVIQYHIVCYSDHGQSIFKGKHHGPNYYLSPANIYGLGIHDSTNNICSVYTWNKSEGNKWTNNISCCLLFWINYKGYYSKSYGKNHKMPEITILVDNCGNQNNNNVMIHFLNMIK